MYVIIQVLLSKITVELSRHFDFQDGSCLPSLSLKFKFVWTLKHKGRICISLPNFNKKWSKRYSDIVIMQFSTGWLSAMLGCKNY